ncbi:MAG: site-2 protease family protein [Patescibacteria group bacterium]
MQIDIVFPILLLIMSIVIHEVSHGYAAEALGDPTARYAGRLTLNPIAHLELVGSIIVPIITALVPPHMVFGWAKPVPVNPYNLKNQRWGEVLVSAAGPASNLAIAIIFGLLIRFDVIYQFLPVTFASPVVTLVYINLLLAVFNLVPIAPLDGSKILFGFFPARLFHIRNWIESHSLIILIFFILFLWQFVDPLITFLFRLITGL